MYRIDPDDGPFGSRARKEREREASLVAALVGSEARKRKTIYDAKTAALNQRPRGSSTAMAGDALGSALGSIGSLFGRNTSNESPSWSTGFQPGLDLAPNAWSYTSDFTAPAGSASSWTPSWSTGFRSDLNLDLGLNSWKPDYSFFGS